MSFSLYEAIAMLSPRYTVRLPQALDAAVQERLRTSGVPFATLIREALAAYLAHTQPPGTDSAATLRELQAQLAALTKRVEALEQQPCVHRQDVDRAPDRLPTPADTPVPPGHRRCRPKGLIRERIDALLQAHPAGLRAEQIRASLSPERPIGNILQGMQRTGTVRVQRQGRRLLSCAQETAR